MVSCWREIFCSPLADRQTHEQQVRVWPLTFQVVWLRLSFSFSLGLSFLSGLIRSWMTVFSRGDQSPGTLRRSAGVCGLADCVGRRCVCVFYVCICVCVSVVRWDVQGEPPSAVTVIRHTENHFTDPGGAGKGHTGVHTRTQTHTHTHTHTLTQTHAHTHTHTRTHTHTHITAAHLRWITMIAVSETLHIYTFLFSKRKTITFDQPSKKHTLTSICQFFLRVVDCDVNFFTLVSV